jgi:hypothetical protein
MSAVDSLITLQKRGYITEEARDRILLKRASIVVSTIANTTSACFSKTAGAAEEVRPGVLARMGKAFKGSGERGWPEWIAGIGKTVGLGAGLAAGGAAVGAAGHAIGNMGLKKKIKSSRAEVANMIGEKNPELRSQQDEVFDAIARYAPTLASDPLVAAGIVQGIAPPSTGRSRSLPHVDQNFVANLAQAERAIHQTRSTARSSTRFGEMYQGTANHKFDS